MSVPMPEKKIAVFGLKPMITGRGRSPEHGEDVLAPRASDCAAGGRSSGAMIHRA